MIDVIVVNLNRPEETRQTINALFKANKNIRVILINNGSVKKPNKIGNRTVVVNLKKNVGQAAAVNVGLNMSTSEYVCCMHNDIVIHDKNWIRKAINFLSENKQAGLVDVYGWKIIEGKLRSITSMRGHRKTMQPSRDFLEVPRTDEMANIFKNDGLRADERYWRTCLGIWIDVLGRGQKLYVIKLKDAEHLGTHEENKGRFITANRREIRLLKLDGYGIIDPVARN